MNAVDSSTRAIAVSTSPRMRSYWAFRSTIGTFRPRSIASSFRAIMAPPRERGGGANGASYRRRRGFAIPAAEGEVAAALRVCMFVINTVAADARVIREASTLSGAGHDVFVVAMREGAQPARDRLEGFTVLRVRRDPVRRNIESSAPAPGRLARAFEPLTLAWALADYWVRGFRQAVALRAGAYPAHHLVPLPVAW